MSLCRQAGYTTSTEDKNLLRDGLERRPADVFVGNYERDTHACLDVAIVAGGDVDGIRKKEVAKRREYLVDVENAGYRFLPFVMELLEDWGRNPSAFSGPGEGATQRGYHAIYVRKAK
jgi:hypothetical protein